MMDHGIHFTAYINAYYSDDDKRDDDSHDITPLFSQPGDNYSRDNDDHDKSMIPKMQP